MPNTTNQTHMKKILQIKVDTLSSICLISFSIIAIYLANSTIYSHHYESFFSAYFGSLSIKEWICDVLMAFFFLTVTLDLKKEFLIGSLAKKDQMLLPLIGAIGGMIVPAAIFLLINISEPQNYRAFAVPCATDIAFAVGVFTIVMGAKISTPAKMFLLALAIFDDLGAIILIASCYSDDILLKPILLVLVGIAILIYHNRNNSNNILYYFASGVLIWVGLHVSGIHTTISGVIVGAFFPITQKTQFLQKSEDILNKIVKIGILPLFALSACNIDFSILNPKSFTHPITLGVFLGLFLGKQIGVFFFTWMTIKIGSIRMINLSWWDIYVISVVAGIGFTMSLFIGELSFTDKGSLNFVRTGLVLASVSSVLWSLALVQIKNLSGKKC
jgi:NhaA family Na+:H+ antiporter